MPSAQSAGPGPGRGPDDRAFADAGVGGLVDGHVLAVVAGGDESDLVVAEAGLFKGADGLLRRERSRKMPTMVLLVVVVMDPSGEWE